MRNAMDLLVAGQHMLKHSERKVSNYILKHQQEVIHLTLSELAQRSGTSEATVIRMCRSLQFKGYKDFKLQLVAALHQTTERRAQYVDVYPITSTRKAIETIVASNLRSIEQTLVVLKEESVEQTIHHLKVAKKIIVIGMGASGIVALHFEQKLKRINLWCEAAIDFHAQLVAVSNAQKGDVVMAISYSGETKEMHKILQLARDRGATTIALTQYSNNTLQRLAQIALFIPISEAEKRTTATSSTIAQMTVVDIVYSGLVAKNFEQYVASLDETGQVIRQFVK